MRVQSQRSQSSRWDLQVGHKKNHQIESWIQAVQGTTRVEAAIISQMFRGMDQIYYMLSILHLANANARVIGSSHL